MRIVLIGADGQLGSDLLPILQDRHEVLAWNFPAVDITRTADIERRLQRQRPDLIINTAAYNRVDDAEKEPAAAFALNALAVRDLAVLSRKGKTALMHFSSDYVFDGARKAPYHEGCPPNPLNVYGVSKLAGEFFLRHLQPRHFLVRTCGLYGTAGCRGKGTNFVDAMVRLGQRGESIRVVNDQWVTPTSSRELAQRLADLIDLGRFGLYHMTNEGRCTWYEFACEIFRQLGKTVKIEAVDSRSFGAAAPRPAFSVLENRNAARAGLPAFSRWQDALGDYLRRKEYPED